MVASEIHFGVPRTHPSSRAMRGSPAANANPRRDSESPRSCAASRTGCRLLGGGRAPERLGPKRLVQRRGGLEAVVAVVWRILDEHRDALPDAAPPGDAERGREAGRVRVREVEPDEDPALGGDERAQPLADEC